MSTVKREYESKVLVCNLARMEMENNIATLEFVSLEGIKIVEELDLLNTHELFRFSMFLESFHIKNLQNARKLLDIFIREGIEIELVVDRRHNIIYSNMLKEDQLYEFKKHILLSKLLSERKLTREMYDEMRDMKYKEVRSVVG